MQIERVFAKDTEGRDNQPSCGRLTAKKHQKNKELAKESKKICGSIHMASQPYGKMAMLTNMLLIVPLLKTNQTIIQ